MDLKSWIAFVGALVAVAAVAALYFTLGIGWIALSIVVGLILGLFNLLAVFRPISQSEVYQGFVGYLNWVMPMSWLSVALGFLFHRVSLLLHAVTAGRVPYLRAQDFAAEWKTGTFFVRGGLIANLNPIDTALNMGSFSFVDYKSSGWHKEHEAGHTFGPRIQAASARNCSPDGVKRNPGRYGNPPGPRDSRIPLRSIRATELRVAPSIPVYKGQAHRTVARME